jgi:hypothetical protein
MGIDKKILSLLSPPKPPQDIEVQLALQQPTWGLDESKDKIKATWLG